MRAQLFALFFGLLAAGFMVGLLRHRIVREKYAVIWLLVSMAVAFFSVFQDALGAVASLLGIQNATNLVFFVAAIVLLLISVQYSVELSKLEEKCRTLAEEVAMVRAQCQSDQADGGTSD